MKLTVITSNPGKLKEFRSALDAIGIETDHTRIPYEEIQTPDPEDVVKAGMEEIRAKGMSNFIIDDSGLFIDSMDGFPGVYSAYVQNTIGNAGILKLMNGETGRGAEFRCCIGCDIGGRTMIVTGICRGTILEKERGEEGFGFDPLFSADGTRSFAEMPIEEKNKISHRGTAIGMLAEELKKLCGKQ